MTQFRVKNTSQGHRFFQSASGTVGLDPGQAWEGKLPLFEDKFDTRALDKRPHDFSYNEVKEGEVKKEAIKLPEKEPDWSKMSEADLVIWAKKDKKAVAPNTSRDDLVARAKANFAAANKTA